MSTTETVKVVLLGEAGVGKTAIVEEISRRIVSGNVPYKLKDKIITFKVKTGNNELVHAL